jgi:nucleoside-diphosphate-sugar epimerase
MKQVNILGCGWLGLPLAKSLLEMGFLVKGSTTSTEKISLLENAGIEPFVLELSETEIKGNITCFLENSEILIINIPPKLRGSQQENFVSKIRNIIPFIEKSVVKKIVFVSSTSVYADDNSIVIEQTIPQPETESGKQLWETEKLLQSNPNFKTTVIRFGGLIGDNRHPIHFLTGRQHLENPEAPINLIHQVDCIGIIQTIICHTELAEVSNETLNAVAPFHPTRKEYYTQKAIELKLPSPEFEESKPSIGKTITSEKVETVLNYTFQKPYL